MAASLKISELNALTALADDDLLLVTDTSATTSKKVTYANLKSGLAVAANNLFGVAEGSANFGTFTGTTVGDNLTLKNIIQALETATELRATTADPTFTTKISSPAFHAEGSNHLVLKAMTGNDLKVHLAGEETLQVTRHTSTGNTVFTSGGGSKEFVFNQLIEALGGIKLDGTTITSWSDLVANINLDDLTTLTGVAAGGTSLGTFTGSTIADSANIKAALQALETTLEAVDIDTDDMATLVGLAENIQNLGTFTGSTIADNDSIKDALQALETAAELRATIDSPTFTTKIQSPEFHSAGSHLKFKTATNDIIFYPGNTETLQITRHSGTGHPTFTANGGSGEFKFNQIVEVAGGLKLDSVSLTTVQIASESFADNDTSLMTSAAINDLIVANSSNTLADLGVTATAAEVNVLDGVTAGTVIASKGLVADANIDITGGRNITISGELDAATGDFSGDVDIDGTTNLDVVDIDGAVQIDATVTVGVDDTGYDVKFFGDTASAYALWDASADDLILGGAAGLEIPNAGRFVLGGNVVTAVSCALDMRNDLVFTGGARNIKFKDNTYNACRFQANNGDIFMGMDTQGDNTIFFQQPLDINTSAQIDGTLTVGVDDTGFDVKFFGATASAYMLWDESADDLILGGAAGLVVPDGQFTLGSTAVTSTAAELNVTDGVTAGTAIASKALVADANIDLTGLRNLTITGDLSVAGSMTTVDTVTMTAQNAIVFEGATADAHESTLTIIDPTADRTIKLPNQSGCLPLLAADSATAITSTPEELNLLDGITAGTVSASLAVIVDGNKDITGFRNITATGDVTIPDGDLILGSTAVTSTAAELNVTDGVTAGTVIASKALVADANIDITGGRNITITGELDAATLDISGDADIDGTTNLDAVDIDGNVQADGTVTVGVDDTGYDVKFFGATSGASLLWDESADDLILAGAAGLIVPDGQFTLGSTAVTSTAAELNLVDGITAGTVSASKAVIADGNKDALGFRNVTATGEVDCATLDVSSTSAFADNVVIENGKEIRLSEASGNGTNYTGFKAPAALTANVSFTLPDGDGTDGQVITTNGSAVLAWSDGPSAPEFNGVTAGTVAASKGVEVDSNKDITGFRNVTLTGELDAATGDFSGDVDIDGTANLDAVDIDGDVDIAGDLTFSAAKDIHFIDNNAAALEFAEAGNAYLTFVTTDSSEAVKFSKNLDIDASDIDLSTQVVDLTIIDNQAQAFRIMEGSTEYLRVTTTNSGEKIDVSTTLQLDGAVDINGAVDCSGDVTFSDAQSISMTDNLGFALRVMEGSNEYVRFVTTDGSEEVDFSKSVKLDGGMTLGGGINVPASQDITLVASNSNALDFVIASGNRMMRFNTSTETVLMEQNIDVGGTANLDAVDIDGATQIDAAVTVGVDDTGYDVKFFGATSGASLLWDQSADDLILGGAAGLVVPDGQLTLASTAVTSTAAELNLLDGSTDGTWTATLEGGSGAPGSKVTATGHYVRMGKLINAFVLFLNVDTSSYAGSISVSGLPVTAKDTTNATFIGSAHNVGMISGANDSIMALVTNNSTTMNFIENSTLTALNWGTVGTGKSMRVAIQYIAA